MQATSRNHWQQTTEVSKQTNELMQKICWGKTQVLLNVVDRYTQRRQKEFRISHR